jgi:hypothetical protein
VAVSVIVVDHLTEYAATGVALFGETDVQLAVDFECVRARRFDG